MNTELIKKMTIPELVSLVRYCDKKMTEFSKGYVYVNKIDLTKYDTFKAVLNAELEERVNEIIGGE